MNFMDTQCLQTFIKLAEYKNFTKTADSLFIAQSTVTNRIAELEREVGCQLFERNKRKVILTSEGEIFLSYAKRITELSDTGIRELHSLNRFSNILKIGTANTIYECHLFPKIKNYVASNPDNGVKITIGHSHDLLQGIQDKLFDVVYSYIPFYKSGYQCELFAKDKLVLVTNFQNNTYSEGIHQKELVKANYLYCNFALQEVGLFIRELFPPHYQFGFEINNATKLIPYLLVSSGISFLPESIAEPYLISNQLRVIPLIDFDSPKLNCYKIYSVNNENATLL